VALSERYGVDDADRVAEPFLDLPRRAVPPRAAVLVLHGGKARSMGSVEPEQLAVRRMQPFARTIAAQDDGVAVGRLRYRYRGWNDVEAHPVADVAFALTVIEACYGPVPVVLVGHSMGGRAALRASGHVSVRGVVALAPWLPGTEPVEQLAARDLVVLHGTRDATTSPGASSHFAERAAPVARRVACLRVPWSGHGMLLRAPLWHRLTAGFVGAIVRDEPFAPVLGDALAARCHACAPEAGG
jgi:predicted esterase